MAILKWRNLMVFCCVAAFISAAAAQQDCAELVRDDRAEFAVDDYWTYNDLGTAIAKANDTGRPLLIVFR